MHAADAHLIKLSAQSLSLIVQVADTRSKGRFDGVLPEPKAELHSGHTLGTLNVPYTTVIDPHTKTMKSLTGIKDGTCTVCLHCTCTLHCVKESYHYMYMDYTIYVD